MQRVSLFGYAKTTRALAKKLYPHAVFYDDKCTKPFTDEDGFRVKPSSDFEPLYSDMEVPSPGIPPKNPMIQKARNLKSEYDIFADTKPLKVWISGTNGKTTTTQMTDFLLKERGSEAGGNIGSPLAELDQEASVWVLETSSFTMHYTNTAKPDIYLLLPITPDHLSWHGSMGEYIDAKLKPLSMMREGEVAVIPHAYKDVKTAAHVIAYKDELDLAAKFGIEVEKVRFKGAFAMDALLAMAVDKILFDRVDYDKINSFVIDPHRQEELHDAKGRLWVNDTKATNIDAAMAALKRYENLHVRLILGGDDKGVDMSELFVFLQGRDVKIYTIGSNKQKLSDLAREYGVEFVTCKNLVDAVGNIDKELKEGEAALLSPAAASLDEFASYAHRGDTFKNAVKELK